MSASADGQHALQFHFLHRFQDQTGESLHSMLTECLTQKVLDLGSAGAASASAAASAAAKQASSAVCIVMSFYVAYTI